jgi:hypothetical protein
VFITIAAVFVVLILGGYLLMSALVFLLDFLEKRRKNLHP